MSINHTKQKFNNEEPVNRQSLYPAVGLEMGVDTRLLHYILNYSDDSARQLKSLTLDDFEKIKQAFHKYLPSPSNRNLDSIDLDPLKFIYRGKEARCQISHKMREIIRDGVNTIADAILENGNMKESQNAVSRKTNRETVETSMNIVDNSNQDSLVEHQPKKAKTAVQVDNKLAHNPFWFEEVFGPESNDTKTTSRNDQSSSTQEAAHIFLFPKDALMSIDHTKQKYNTYSYPYRENSGKSIKKNEEDNAFSTSCNRDLSNNAYSNFGNKKILNNDEESVNRKCHYRVIGREIMGIDSRILPSMLNLSEDHGQQLRSLTLDDFEKIKQAFHKYLPSPSNRNLDSIDLDPLKFIYRGKEARCQISHKMREIIRDGVNTIADGILKNGNMKESQAAVSCNNEGSANQQSEYHAVGLKIMGVHSTLLPSILNSSYMNGRPLKSLGSEDFEKIRQAFHKYLPSPSSHNLDSIDLGPLKFIYRDKEVRYKISDQMREIIRDGVNTILEMEI